VIDALTSHAFNRAEFLRTLNRFYVAIENAARGLTVERQLELPAHCLTGKPYRRPDAASPKILPGRRAMQRALNCLSL
jgi:hypothetical protein